jgi:hypothetical protein
VGADRWAPPGAAALGNRPERTRGEREGAALGAAGPRAARPARTGVGRAREKVRGREIAAGLRARGVLAGPQGEGEGRDGEKGFFRFLIYFLNACFTNSLNKQNRCMVRHGATTKRFNPRVLLTQDVELILARALKKNNA